MHDKAKLKRSRVFNHILDYKLSNKVRTQSKDYLENQRLGIIDNFLRFFGTSLLVNHLQLRCRKKKDYEQKALYEVIVGTILMALIAKYFISFSV